MKALVLALVLLVPSVVFGQYLLSDLADVPPSLRQENWMGQRWCNECNTYHPKMGSCVHASIMTLLSYHGLDDWAFWWKINYGGGETASSIIEIMNGTGLPFTYTEHGEVAFLEYATRNRLGCIIWYFPAHCVTLVDLTPTHAILIDNNSPGDYIPVPRVEFLDRWQNQYGGFALTLVLPPPPPAPRL